MPSLWAPAPASLVAFITTVHVGLLVLQHARGAGRVRQYPLLVVSAALTASPWLFSTPAALALLLAAHSAWFAIAERFGAATVATRAGATAAATMTASAAPAAMASRPRAAAPVRPRGFVPASVIAVHDETAAIRTFRIARPEDFTFEAGQFVTVQVQVDGTPHARCYSICSAPEATGYLEIAVRRHGLVSSVLHATARPGSRLLLRAPAGRFVYPRGDDRPLVLVAGGVGITPLIGMLRHAVLADPQRPIHLLLSANTAADVPFRDELATTSRRHPHVQVTVAITGEPASLPLHAGRIDADLVRASVPEPRHSIFMLCGPPPMVADMRTLLAALDVPDGQVRSELFQPAAAIGATDAAPLTEPINGHGYLTFEKSGTRVAVDRRRTLLETAEGAGVAIPSMCRSGTCGTCRTRVLSGEARCSSDVLDADDRDAGYVLPCVTWVAGDCAVDA